MIPWKQKWSLHLHPCCCLYTCHYFTFFLPLWSCCLLLLPELGNTHAEVVCCTINFGYMSVSLGGRNGTTTCKGVHQKSAHPLRTMKTHKWATSKSTQDLISTSLGQTAHSASRIFLKLKSEALYLAEYLNLLHMHSDPIVNTHIKQDKSLGPGIAGQSLLSY